MENYSLFEEKADTWLTLPNGLIYWDANFLQEPNATQLFKKRLNTTPWKQDSINIFGKSVLQPRLHSWHGNAQYTYSGLTKSPQPWTNEVQALEKVCANIAGQRFNAVLINMYEMVTTL